MNPKFWEELGVSGVKAIVALLELGGRASYLDIMATAHVGRASYDRMYESFVKYDLVKVTRNDRRIQLELTEKGRRVAELLAEIERISTASPGLRQ